MGEWIKPCVGYKPSEKANKECFNAYMKLLSMLYRCPEPQLLYSSDIDFETEDNEVVVLLEGQNGKMAFYISDEAIACQEKFDLMDLYTDMARQLKLHYIKNGKPASETQLDIATVYGLAIIGLICGSACNLPVSISNKEIKDIENEMRLGLVDNLKESNFDPIKAGLIP